MARIASTTTAGTPIDGNGGMTLDALMLRAKEAADRRNAITATPRDMSSPWQVVGGLAQAFSNQRQQSSAEEQLAEGRQTLAKIRAGIDLDAGPTSDQIAQASLLDPEYADRLTQMAADVVKQRRERGYSVEDREDTQTAASDLQTGQQTYTTGENEKTRQATAEQNRLTLAAQAAEAAAKRAEPQTDLGKIEADYRSGAYGQPGSPEATTMKNAAIEKAVNIAKGRGMEIEFGPDGQIVGFREGEGVGQGGTGTQGPKNLANALEDYRLGAKAGADLLPTIENMEKAYKGTGYTGPGAEWYDTADNFLESVGSPVTLPGSSASRQVVKGGGLAFIQDAIAKSKGSISDAENKLFASGSAGLTTTPEGSKMLLGIARAVAQRNIQRADEANAWVAKNKSLDGFESYWSSKIAGDPIIIGNDDGTIALSPKYGAAAAAGPSEADIQATMEANPGMTREQVLAAVAAKTKGGAGGGP